MHISLVRASETLPIRFIGLPSATPEFEENGRKTNLSSAYYFRMWEDRAENLEQAINAFQQALRVYSCEKFPTQWSVIHNNLGNAYSNRIRQDRVEKLERAIAAYQQSLKVRTREKFPIE